MRRLGYKRRYGRFRSRGRIYVGSGSDAAGLQSDDGRPEEASMAAMSFRKGGKYDAILLSVV